MSDKRKQLQVMLENILGSTNVYFQPPDTLRMKYPAIRYTRDKILSDDANNAKYGIRTSYTMTYITHDVDDDVVYKLLKLPYCTHDKSFRTQGLQHDTFTIIV